MFSRGAATRAKGQSEVSSKTQTSARPSQIQRWRAIDMGAPSTPLPACARRKVLVHLPLDLHRDRRRFHPLLRRRDRTQIIQGRICQITTSALRLVRAATKLRQSPCRNDASNRSTSISTVLIPLSYRRTSYCASPMKKVSSRSWRPCAGSGLSTSTSLQLEIASSRKPCIASRASQRKGVMASFSRP